MYVNWKQKICEFVMHAFRRSKSLRVTSHHIYFIHHAQYTNLYLVTLTFRNRNTQFYTPRKGGLHFHPSTDATFFPRN